MVHLIQPIGVSQTEHPVLLQTMETGLAVLAADSVRTIRDVLGRHRDDPTRGWTDRVMAEKTVYTMKLIIATTVATTLALTPLLAQEKEPGKRLDDAAVVFSEIMAAPDKGIPQDLLQKSHCIVIVPELKTAAFGVGGKYGKGYLSCRNKSGTGWSAPGTVRIEGGSVGFQIGGSSTDLIMLVMSERGADKLLASKFTLGAEGSAAAGPVGRTATAQTDAQMHADILSWSRTHGLFVGVALEGATLREDLDDNATLYGKKLENRAIVREGVPAPKAAAKLLELLNRYSAKERTD
jgi:lipid-binding SYLF domain-containing protein